MNNRSAALIVYTVYNRSTAQAIVIGILTFAWSAMIMCLFTWLTTFRILWTRMTLTLH